MPETNDHLDRIATALERIAEMLEARQQAETRSGGTGNGPPGGGG